jgi:hypothetical protein
MTPYAFNTSVFVYVNVVRPKWPTDRNFVTWTTPDIPKKDWHAMVDMKGLLCEVLRASKIAYVGQHVSTPVSLSELPSRILTGVYAEGQKPGEYTAVVCGS